MLTPSDVQFYENYFTCRKCSGAVCYKDPKHGDRPVFDEGSPNPDYLLVGMNPGKDEIIRGVPFVGKAGEALRYIMAEAQKIWKTNTGSTEEPLLNGLFTNLAKCQFLFGDTKSNRKPTEDEYNNCRPIFDKMFDAVRPKLVVMCGADVIHKFGITTTITNCHGQVMNLEYMDIPFRGIPVFHPSYYARNAGVENLGPVIREQMIQVFIKVCTLIQENKKLDSEMSNDI